MNRLSNEELAVIEATHLSWGAPAKVLAHKVGLGESTFRRVSERLIATGILLPFTVIDVYRLGFAEYCILATLSAAGHRRREALLEFLTKNRAVSWHLEVGGDFDIEICVRASGPMDISKFSEALTSEFGRVFSRTIVSQSIGFSVFQRVYSSQKPQKRDSLTCGYHRELVEVDSKDHKLLDHLMRYPRHTMREISRRTNISHSTLDYRLKHLQKLGIVRGTICRMHPRDIGYTSFRLLVSTTGLGMAIKDKMFEFCLAQPSVINLDSMIGGWDFELRCEVQQPSDISNLKADLISQFEKDISMVQVLPVLHEGMTELMPDR